MMTALQVNVNRASQGTAPQFPLTHTSDDDAPLHAGDLVGIMQDVGIALDRAMRAARIIGDAPLLAALDQMRSEWAARLQALPPVAMVLPAYRITLDLHESEDTLILDAASADGALSRARQALDTLGYGRARLSGPAGFYREVWA